MEPLMKKYQTLKSNSEVKLEETPPIPTLSSPNPRKKKSTLPHSPNLSLLTSVNHLSNLDHWLVQWHRLRQQPPSLTAWWPEPWELEYPKEETPPTPKESSEHFSPHNTIKEMEVEMILLNLTDEILENTRKEGQEVVEVEMTQTQLVEEVVEEADLSGRQQRCGQSRGTIRQDDWQRARHFQWRSRQSGGIHDQLERLLWDQQTD